MLAFYSRLVTLRVDMTREGGERSANPRRPLGVRFTARGTIASMSLASRTKAKETMDLNQNPLAAITMSSADGPARVVIHGQGGTGKTSTACYMPKPIIIGPEEGVPRDLGFQVATVRPRSWRHLRDIVASLTADDHQYETGVIDTLDWLEPMLHEHVCERDSGRETEMNKKGKPLISIEDYGFGRGFLVAEEEFVRLLSDLDVLQYRRRMHWVFLVHTIVRPFRNPMGPDYDRYEMKAHQRVSSKAYEWAETVAFLHFRRDAGKISEDKERYKDSAAKAKAIEGVGQRLVGLQDSALYDAKNRVRLPAVIDMPLDPNALVSMLLGEHLRGGVQAFADRQVRTPMTTAPAPAPRVVPSSQTRRPEPEPPRSADYYDQQPSRTDQRSLERSGRGDPTLEALDRGQPPPLDERQSRDNVVPFDTRRGQPHPNAPQQAPHPNAPPPAGATSKSPPHVAHANAQRASGEQQADQTRRLYDATTAGGRLGPQYREDMKIWIERAAGDPMRIDAIIKKINADVADAQGRQQQNPNR